MGIADRDYNRSGYGGRGGGGSMGGGMDGLRRFLNLSFPVGTYIGVAVRVHITFLLFLAFRLLTAPVDWLYTLQWMTILFLSVLLHEFGHIIGCRLTGGRANEIIMWPLGGLAMCQPRQTVKSHFVTTACGPLVNVILCIVSFAALAGINGTLAVVSWNPFSFAGPTIDATTANRLLVATFYANYILLLFNMALLFYPFDGGRLVQAALWRFVGYVRSMRISLALGMVGAVVVGLIGLFNGNLMLMLIAVFGFITCYQSQQQLRMAHGTGASFGDSYSFADDDAAGGPGFFEKRKREKASKAAQRNAEAAAKEQAEIDRILEKVSAEGMHSLTSAERKTLERASKKMKAG